MNIIIKCIKLTVLLFSAFLALNIYSIGQDRIKIDVTHASIDKEIKEMVKKCKSHCSSVQNALNREECEEKYIKDYSKQRERYLVRKYTKLCTGGLFDEPWRYKTKVEEVVVDLAETTKAYDLWENPDIRRQTQECLAQYTEKLQFVLRKATEMEIEKEKEKIIEEENEKLCSLNKFNRFKVGIESNIGSENDIEKITQYYPSDLD